KYLLAICLAGFSTVCAAATYWQIQMPTATTVVEGDADTAKAVTATILRQQVAARSLLSWPDSYREPPVLAFVVDEGLLRRAFRFPSDPVRAYTSPTERHGTWGRTPALTVLATAMGYERGHELRSLQHMYGEALVDAEP